MKTYRVWDEANQEEDDAQEIESWSEEEAAKEYAENDTDGHCDGLYLSGKNQTMDNLHEHGHVICVRDEDGVLTRWAVGVVEFEPVYGAEQLPALESAVCP